MNSARFLLYLLSVRRVLFAHLLFLPAVSLILASAPGTCQSATVQKLKLSQVEDLISHGVPDSTMSAQIRIHGLAFSPTTADIESLRAKGAGPQTLAAIEAAISGAARPGQVKPSDGAASTSGNGLHFGPAPKSTAPSKVDLPAATADGLLLQKTQPRYPPIARAARISGTVVLQATISNTGSIEDLHVVDGPAMLQQAALDAVKDWRYKPYLVNNQPVEVVTTVNVIFTLGPSK